MHIRITYKHHLRIGSELKTKQNQIDNQNQSHLNLIIYLENHYTTAIKYQFLTLTALLTAFLARSSSSAMDTPFIRGARHESTWFDT